MLLEYSEVPFHPLRRRSLLPAPRLAHEGSLQADDVRRETLHRGIIRRQPENVIKEDPHTGTVSRGPRKCVHT